MILEGIDEGFGYSDASGTMLAGISIIDQEVDRILHEILSRTRLQYPLLIGRQRDNLG